jgi:hypothetical protein
MKNSLTHDTSTIIGFDEIPPAGYNFTLPRLVIPREEPAEIWYSGDVIGFDEIPPHGYQAGSRYLDPSERISADENAVFEHLDEASEAGAESTQVLLARLVALNIPECEGLRLVTVWRQGHADPWIRAHDDNAELFCK